MNLFELFVKIGVDDEASDKISKLSGKIGSGLKTAAKVGTVAVTAAAAGITALTTAAVNNFAEYEQLAGGAELLFGKAFGTVQKNAQEAYKTVQMSQNEYLQQVNGFSTGLKTALGGNEQAAADLAHRIVVAEADIIAATGNTAENVQNAFNGIMKSNFTMLDNLQLGITPTKEGFQEVIDKVNEWNTANGNATKYQMGNLADMQSALVDYIEMQGLAGYAAGEASETISGSVSSMKAAWTNLVTGIADDNANLGELINSLVNSITGYVDESGNKVKGVADNILPVIEQALGGIATLIEKLAPVIVEKISSLVSTILPSLISGATGMVNSVIAVLPSLLETVVTALVENAPLLIEAGIGLVNSLIQGIQNNAQILMDGAINIITAITNGILNMLPQIISLGLDLIVSLANGIANSLPELIPTIVDVVLQIVDTLTNPETLINLVGAALEIIIALATGLIDALPNIIQRLPEIIDGIINGLLGSLDLMVDAGVQLLTALIANLPRIIVEIVKAAPKIVTSLVKGFIGLSGQMATVGLDLVKGIWAGISDAAEWLWGKIKEWSGKLVDKVKGFFGIHSPSTVFAGIGGNMALGLGEGWDDEFSKVQKDITKNLDFGTAKVNFASSAAGISSAGIVNGVSSGVRSIGGNLAVNMMLPDGRIVATQYINDFLRVAEQNGTPIANPIS